MGLGPVRRGRSRDRKWTPGADGGGLGPLSPRKPVAPRCREHAGRTAPGSCQHPRFRREENGRQRTGETPGLSHPVGPRVGRYQENPQFAQLEGARGSPKLRVTVVQAVLYL